MHTDPIADMLTRLRNGQQARQDSGAEAGLVEVRPKLEGMNMFIMLSPKKK